MSLGRDIWRVGVAPSPIEAVAQARAVAWDDVRWLPQGPPTAFLADPFGVWRDGRLHLFAEAYDYRSRHGVIDHLELDEDRRVVSRRTVLREAWHLSYPYVFEDEAGALWMAPEAHRSGVLTLYRSVAFPAAWEAAVRLELDTAAIDPTVFRHEGLWWIAYAPSGAQSSKQGRLHLAWAERLTGPWRAHAGNAVRVDRGSSRPGGRPFVSRGVLTLPVQDCRRTYGGAIRFLQIHELTPERLVAEAQGGLAPPPGSAGLHTLSGCGPVTLLDVKRIDRSPAVLLAGLGAGRRT